MQTLLRSALVGALALAPGFALAQMIIEEPAPVVGEPAVVVQQPTMVVPAPVVSGPIGVEDARAIAMMNGLVTVEDVDQRWWDGNFVVEGEDGSGEGMEITIDADSGAVLDIDS